MSANQDPASNIPPRVRDLIGPGTLAALLAPETVERVTIYCGNDDNPNRLAGFRIKGKAAPLTREGLAVLQKALLDENTYDFVFTATVPFMPGIGLRLKQKEEEAVILLDLDRRKVIFISGSYRRTRDLAALSGGLQALRTLAEQSGGETQS